MHPFDAGSDLVELLAESPEWRESQADVAAAGDGLPLDEVVLLPPVYPVAMRDFLTFEAHVDGMERGHGNPGPPADWYDAPVFLFMAPHAVTGPYDDVAMPPDTERLDFELEIAAIICRDVRNASPDGGPGRDRRLLRDERLVRARRPGQGDAAQARPVQGQGLRDHDRPLGRHRRRARRPPRRRRLPRPRDDGQRSTASSVGGDRSGHMGWSFEQLVSHASRASWVKAGEVLASGHLRVRLARRVRGAAPAR